MVVFFCFLARRALSLRVFSSTLLEITTVDVSENEDRGLSFKKKGACEKLIGALRFNLEIFRPMVTPKGEVGGSIAAAVVRVGERVKADVEKVAPSLKATAPRTVMEVRVFLGSMQLVGGR